MDVALVVRVIVVVFPEATVILPAGFTVSASAEAAVGLIVKSPFIVSAPPAVKVRPEVIVGFKYKFP